MDADKEIEYKLDPIVVTGSRIPSLLSELGQSIEVISAEQIKEIPVSTLDEVLKYIAGIDVRQRGAGNVQSDVSIRGSTFEQTLVLIDGMAMNDPQTGHHNMNLPINLDDIERIEIVKGTASRIYGPNAMGGVIIVFATPACEPGRPFLKKRVPPAWRSAAIGRSTCGCVAHTVISPDRFDRTVVPAC